MHLVLDSFHTMRTRGWEWTPQTSFALFIYVNCYSVGHLEMKATPRGPGYLCWKKGCNQYFKSTIALHTHFKEIHVRPSSGSPSLPQPAASSQVTPTGVSRWEENI